LCPLYPTFSHIGEKGLSMIRFVKNDILKIIRPMV